MVMLTMLTMLVALRAWVAVVLEMVALLVRWAPAEPLKLLTATIWLSPSQMSKGGELALLLSREA